MPIHHFKRLLLMVVAVACLPAIPVAGQQGPGGPFVTPPNPGIAFGGPYDYQFVQNGTGEVIALIEIDLFPADELSELNSFEFTDAGNAIFALGTDNLSGIFDLFSGTVIEDGIRGIQGQNAPDGTPASAEFTSAAPPLPSSLINYPGLDTLGSFSVEIGKPNAPDRIRFFYQTVGGQGDVLEASGNWVQVPEPSSIVLLSLGGLIFVCRGRFRTIEPLSKRKVSTT